MYCAEPKEPTQLGSLCGSDVRNICIGRNLGFRIMTEQIMTGRLANPNMITRVCMRYKLMGTLWMLVDDSSLHDQREKQLYSRTRGSGEML